MKLLSLICLYLSVALAFVGTTSCSTKAGTGTLIGVGAGGAVGAGVGAAVGGGKGAAIGGAVGAIAGGATGAAIGAYMDRQEKELKESVQNADVERVGDNLVVRFESAILFDIGKADLRASSRQDLAAFAEVLTKYADTDISVEGHTDSTGSKSLNRGLSKSRADSVARYLNNRGVAQQRMTTVGLADDQPVGDNNTSQGRQANRRVEVKISANEAMQQKSGEQG